MNYLEACNLVSASLRTIETYLDRPEEVPNELVREAFANIARIVEAEPLLKELGVESLNRIHQACERYLQDKPEHRPLVLRIMNVFGKAQKQKSAREIDPLIQDAIRLDDTNRKSQIQSRVACWERLAPAKARADMRVFIMGACTGQGEFYSSSMSFLRKEISEILPPNSPLQLLLADAELFSSLELKTGTLIDEDIPIRLIRQCVLEQQGYTISCNQDIDHTLEELRRQRLFRLHNLTEVYNRVIVHPDRPQAVNVKYFPLTEAWYVGTIRREPDNAPFEIEMQEFGANHGIIVVTDSANATLGKRAEKMVIFDDPQMAPYPRDYVEFSLDEVRVPLVRDSFYDRPGSKSIVGYLQRKRRERDPIWSLSEHNGNTISPPAESFAIIGEPWRGNLSEKAIRLALALGVRPIMNLTYSEGGNTLIGTRDDGSPYVIIGRDSYEASRFCMEADLGRNITDDEIKMAFAIDYGVEKEHLYFVEQPGDFHLDMNLAIIGHNTIVVNDAVAAEEAFREDNLRWGEKVRAALVNQSKDDGLDEDMVAIESGMQFAEVKKIFEDKTAQDLITHGFNVERIAGRFDYQTPVGRKAAMNFFNMVTGRSLTGEKIVVAMGVTSVKYQQQFKEMMQKENPDLDTFYFLNLEHSQKSLKFHGGISCRAKIM